MKFFNLSRIIQGAIVVISAPDVAGYVCPIVLKLGKSVARRRSDASPSEGRAHG